MAKFNVAQYTSTIDFPMKRLGFAAAIGAGVGILSWLFSLLLQNIFVEPVFCRSADSFGACANGGTIAIVLSLIIVHTLGLFLLVKAGIYRPLLVVLASLITLFGINVWLGGLSWYEASLWYAFLTALTYALYAWLARMTSFVSALVVIAIVITTLRVIMTQL